MIAPRNPPEQGQLVEVRHRQYVVTEVAQGLHEKKGGEREAGGGERRQKRKAKTMGQGFFRGEKTDEPTIH